MQDGNAIGEIDFEPEMGVEPVVVGTCRSGYVRRRSRVCRKATACWLLTADRFATRSELTAQFGENKGRTRQIDGRAKRRAKRNSDGCQTRRDDGELPHRHRFRKGERSRRANRSASGKRRAYAVNSNLEIIRLTGKVFGQLFSGSARSKMPELPVRSALCRSSRRSSTKPDLLGFVSDSGG